MRISGAQAIVEALDCQGVEIVFGIPGAYNLPLFDALYNHPRIRVITVRHEQAAAFMADGYARASGNIAAALLLPGPGVTNAYTGLGEAYADSSPVLLLASQVNREFINQNRGLLHELTGQLEILAPVTKFSARLTNPRDSTALLHQAMYAIRNGRPRPAQIEIPRDVQVEMFDADSPANCKAPARRERTLPPRSQIETVARLLAAASRPLLFAGGGVVSSEASDVLVELAERLGAPVLTTGMGAGSIPGDHPLACGVAWIASGDIRPLVGAADALVMVGTRLNQAMTHDWQMPLPPVTVRIDIDPAEIERNLPAQHKLVGDARATLAAILEFLKTRGIDRKRAVDATLARAQQDFKRALEQRAGSTLPWMRALRETLPRRAIISADMTVFWADMLATFPLYEPRTMLFPWGYGTLGFGIPETLGAKLACPERPVVSIVGDGAFLFTGMELATAIQYRLNVPILLPNNNAYGMIKKQQGDMYDEQYIGVDLVNPDFVQLAHSFGAYGERVNTPDQLSAALARALAADKPTVIEFEWGWKFAG
ncbi:MAG TPA: thiamine pyrophosphate-binding protein [Anaerolineae bacterium]|nr:thiamine pyrophosphate-binding protein [Anaerolineae bacterium]